MNPTDERPFFYQNGQRIYKPYPTTEPPPAPICILRAVEVVNGKLVPCAEPYVAFMVPGKEAGDA